MNASPRSNNVDPAPGRASSRRFWKPVLGVLGIAAISLGVGSYFTMPGLQPGDRAPNFSATTHTGQQIKLADFLGKQPVVVYFYPRDNTLVCTAQACAFRDGYEDFTKAGAVVIGISSDSAESHQQFATSEKLPFLLVSDTDGSLRKAFGVPKTFGLMPGRVTYVIDREGIVRLAFSSQFSAGKHVTKALEVVQKLK